MESECVINDTVARNLGTNVNGMEGNWREMKGTNLEKNNHGCGARTRGGGGGGVRLADWQVNEAKMML